MHRQIETCLNQSFTFPYWPHLISPHITSYHQNKSIINVGYFFRIKRISQIAHLYLIEFLNMITNHDIDNRKTTIKYQYKVIQQQSRKQKNDISGEKISEQYRRINTRKLIV